MTDQHNQAGRSEESITDAKTSGGWEKKPSAGDGANTQALASENHSEAIQRFIQESNDVAPWNAVDLFRKRALTKRGDANEGKTSTKGATAGSKTSASRK